MDILKPGDEGWSKSMDCPSCGASLKIYSDDLDIQGKAVCGSCGKRLSVVPKAARSAHRTYSRDRLTRAHVEAILRAAKDGIDSNGRHDYLFLRLLALTGRRLDEILGMKPDDIDFQQKCAWVHVEKRKDDSYKNLAFLDDETLYTLETYLHNEWMNAESNKMFPMSRRTYQYMPDKYAKLAGLHIHISPHTFRHYVITSLREQGWSGEDIQKLTGHKDVSSIAAYDSTDARIVEERFRKVKLV